MAFRIADSLIEGILDNTTPGSVHGWVSLYRNGKSPIRCILDLVGDFHDDVRGRILHIWNNDPSEVEHLDHLNPSQKGKTGDVTLVYVQRHAYIEWYSERNGRVVLEIPLTQCEVLGDGVDLSTLPPRKTHPDIFQSYLRELAVALRKEMKSPNASAIGVGPKRTTTTGETERN